jgi:hypothetical protein
MSLRQQTAEMVADYLARGGTIQRVPAPKPTVAADVLQYLQERSIDVQPVVDPTGTMANYVYKGQIINLKTLVAIANRHRSRRRLPPFQLAGRTSH